VSHVRYVLCFYIPEDGIIHSDRRGNLITMFLFPFPIEPIPHTFVYVGVIVLALALWSLSVSIYAIVCGIYQSI
jgi:hypothetical protein